MAYLLSVDVGGTFTDLVVLDRESGQMTSFKSSTTPEEISNGVFACLDLAAENYNLSIKELLMNCDQFIYGSTTATNAIVSDTVAKTGFIGTYGFKDILYIREGGKHSAYDFHKPYPPPYVPRYMTMGVRERITSEGEILIPLNEDDVRKAIQKLKKCGVEAIGVCTLWSIVNPIHEKRIGEIIEEECSDIPYTLSHELNPTIREYRRASATVIDASLKPIVTEHVSNFCSRLRKEGYEEGKTIWFLSSSGGLMPSEEIIKRPIYLINSGPSMCPKAGLSFSTNELGEEAKDILVVDTGGTTFDVSMVRDGRIGITNEMWLKEKFSGHIVGVPAVDVKSIGAGGGSIVWVDQSGLVHVGPKSAGANPGPACYGYGGKEPTVTDAAVVLGYINPSYFLGGRMKIYPDLSKKVIFEKVAKTLGLSLEETASGVMEVLNINTIGAIEDISVKQGFNPRKSVMVGAGGAAPLHIIEVAKKLGIKKVLIPNMCAVLSATGSIFSDIVSEFPMSCFMESNNFDFEKVNQVLCNLKERAEAFLNRAGVPPDQREIEYIVEARYPYQVWEIEVPIGIDQINGKAEVDRIVKDFHKVHERRFGVSEPGQHIELITWKARAIGKMKKPKIAMEKYAGKDPSPALKEERDAYFKEYDDFIKVPRYDGEKLKYGNEIHAPAIIEQPKTTVVVYPGSKVTVTPFGNYLVEIE